MDKAPDAYRTISEVAEDLDIAQHVLRFWETRFLQIKPLKRGGGRRYYRPDDVELLKGIRHLLYKEGYTIKGVQRILKEQGPRAVQALMVQKDAVADWSPPDIEHTPVAQSRAQEVNTPIIAPPRAVLPEMPAPAPVMVQPPVPPVIVPPVTVAPTVFAEEAPVFHSRIEPQLAPPPAFAAEDTAPSPHAITRDDVVSLLREREAGMARGQVSNGQVSMFRGGLHRSEGGSIQAGQLAMQADAHALEEPTPSLQAIRRETLMNALRELDECRVLIEGILAQRAE